MKYLLFILGSIALASSPYSQQERQLYIRKILNVLSDTSKQTAENVSQYINLVGENRCQSAFPSLTLKCLYEEATRNCKARDQTFKTACPIISDVAIVNKINEKQVLSKEERMSLSERSANYAQAYAVALKRKHAMLATEFLLLSKTSCHSIRSDCFARELDKYCIENSDLKNLPWQGCVAAISWFIGEEK